MFQFGRKKMNERSGIVGNEIDVDAQGKMALSYGTITYTTRTIYKSPVLAVSPTFIFSLTIAFL